MLTKAILNKLSEQLKFLQLKAHLQIYFFPIHFEGVFYVKLCKMASISVLKSVTLENSEDPKTRNYWSQRCPLAKIFSTFLRLKGKHF